MSRPRASTAVRRARWQRLRGDLVVSGSIALGVVMEAAWVSVMAALIQEFTLHGPVIELPGMAGFVLVGLVVARFGLVRLPRRWPLVGTLLVFLAAVLGVALGAEARSELTMGHIAEALAAHPGGLLVGLAVLRGYAHAGPRLEADTVSREISIGIPVLAVMAAAGGMVSEPYQSAFFATAGPDSVVFVAAGLLGLALTALGDARASDAVWRPNRTWLLLVAAAVALLLAVAIPVGLVGGPGIVLGLQVLIVGSILPLAIVSVVLGGPSDMRRTIATLGFLALVAWVVSQATRNRDLTIQTGGGAPHAGEVSGALDPVTLVGISGLVVAMVGLVVILLVRAWMVRRSGVIREVGDTRTSTLPGDDAVSGDRRPGRRPRWRRRPRTAAEAYLWLLEDINQQSGTRRRPSETPGEHARRLRADGAGPGWGNRLDFLAADYALAAYARRTISPIETRRAIDRWQILRDRLRHREVEGSRRESVDDGPDPTRPAPRPTP